MKAVVALALLVACSGSSTPGVVIDDAGEAEGVRRGRQGAVDAVAVDVARVVDVVPVVDAAPVVDVVTVMDVVPVMDGRFVDSTAVPDGWGYVDDAGVLHCKYNHGTGGDLSTWRVCPKVSDVYDCIQELTGKLPASCRFGLEPTGWQWVVRDCADCAGGGR